MSEQKTILTPEQVAEIRVPWAWGYNADDVLPLCNTVDALRAEVKELERQAFALVILLRATVNDETWNTVCVTDAGKKYRALLAENEVLREALRGYVSLSWMNGPLPKESPDAV
jgi:hypothetical protein